MSNPRDLLTLAIESEEIIEKCDSDSNHPFGIIEDTATSVEALSSHETRHFCDSFVALGYYSLKCDCGEFIHSRKTLDFLSTPGNDVKLNRFKEFLVTHLGANEIQVILRSLAQLNTSRYDYFIQRLLKTQCDETPRIETQRGRAARK